MDDFDFEEREFVAVMLALVLCVLVPIVIGLGSLFATGWAYVLGAHDVHGLIWGWLSTRKHDAQGHTVWAGGSILWQYYLGAVTAYITYQIAELFGAIFRVFRHALVSA